MQRREGQSVINYIPSEVLGHESPSQRHDTDIFRRIIMLIRLIHLPRSTLLAIGVLSLTLLACNQTPQPTEHGELSTQMLVATFQVSSQIDAHDANPGDGVCAAANGQCTLRAAIEEANASSGKHKVNVPAGTYLLTLGQLEVTDDIIIMGARQGSTVIDAQKNSRVLLIDSSRRRGRERVRAELHFLTIRSGYSFDAAGVFNAGGRVLLQHSRVVGNVADNEAAGIANAYNGIMELRHSTVSDNGDGHFPQLGSIVNYKNSAMYIYNSTIANNEARAVAGIWNEGHMNVVNSTISGNRSMSQFPGGFYNTSENGHAALNNVTIAFNQNNVDNSDSPPGWASGMMNSSFGSTLLIGNSVVANNINHNGSEVDCSGTISSVGYNLIGDTAGCTLVGDLTGNLTGVDPLLQPLAQNGGATQTHAIDKVSPARDAGNPAIPTGVGTTCQPLDQRNMTRGVGLPGRCDMGAFELHGSPGDIIGNP
jgi:hypothetical protein